ncbi:hypothetical protein ABZY02_18690 [Streptomyces sp. NPDC006649]|uniref:hypothetical protein n=1 Tax=Streptomyces sp. NPDC006649 TaxID=3156896 RepID=UPI0033A70AD6
MDRAVAQMLRVADTGADAVVNAAGRAGRPTISPTDSRSGREVQNAHRFPTHRSGAAVTTVALSGRSGGGCAAYWLTTLPQAGEQAGEAGQAGKRTSEEVQPRYA